MHATASARFAMENGRAVLAVAIRDPNSVSIPIDQYIGATTSAPFVIVSDASPTGMCAALYHPATGAIAAWEDSNSLTTATYERSIKETRMPRPPILAHRIDRPHTGLTTTRQYMWINDNTGALQWSAAQNAHQWPAITPTSE
jgi:hypothetical protein